MKNENLQVFLAGHTSSRNRGNEAIVRVLASEISKIDEKIHIILGTNDVAYDKNRLADTPLDIRNNNHVRTRGGKKFRLVHQFTRYLPFHWTPLVPISAIRDSEDILSSDLIVFTGGDHFCYGLNNTMSHAGRLLVARSARIPVAIYAASFNQIESKYELDYLKFLLNQFNYISVRERQSLEIVTKWGLRTPVELVADPAFLLDPCSTERSKEIISAEGLQPLGNVLGFNISFLAPMDIGLDSDVFFKCVAGALDRFVDEFDHRILMISHVSTDDMTNKRHNDRMACLSLRDMMNRKDRCDVLMGEYNTAELKGIISHCTLFCGFRMHSAIASASSYVPTLFIAYSAKAHGIARDLYNTGQWCLDVASITEELLFNRLSKLHSKKDDITDQLHTTVPEMRSSACKGINSLHQLLVNRRIEFKYTI